MEEEWDALCSLEAELEAELRATADPAVTRWEASAYDKAGPDASAISSGVADASVVEMTPSDATTTRGGATSVFSAKTAGSYATRSLWSWSPATRTPVSNPATMPSTSKKPRASRRHAEHAPSPHHGFYDGYASRFALRPGAAPPMESRGSTENAPSFDSVDDPAVDPAAGAFKLGGGAAVRDATVAVGAAVGDAGAVSPPSRNVTASLHGSTSLNNARRLRRLERASSRPVTASDENAKTDATSNAKSTTDAKSTTFADRSGAAKNSSRVVSPRLERLATPKRVTAPSPASRPGGRRPIVAGRAPGDFVHDGDAKATTRVREGDDPRSPSASPPGRNRSDELRKEPLDGSVRVKGGKGVKGGSSDQAATSESPSEYPASVSVVAAVEARLRDQLRHFEARLLRTIEKVNVETFATNSTNATTPLWWVETRPDPTSRFDAYAAEITPDSFANANARLTANARHDPALASDDAPLARKPLRDVKRTIDAYLERNRNAFGPRPGSGWTGYAGHVSTSTSPESCEPVYSPPLSARTNLRQALRDAERASRSASTSPSSSGAVAAFADSRSSSEDDLVDDLATFARGYRSTRLVSRVTEEWTRLARLSVVSANAHHRRVSLHGVFRSWRNVVADADVVARIATRFARAVRRRVVSRALRSWRRDAARSMAFKARERCLGVDALRLTKKDAETMTEDSSRRDADDDIVHRLVDDVAREGWSAVGTISAPTPDAFVRLEEEGSDVESSVRSAAGGEVRRESETSFAGNMRSEEELENGGGRRDDPEVASPLDADAVADAKEAADSARGVDEICHESEVSFAGDTCSEEEFDNGAGRREDQEVASPSDAVADPKDAAAAAVSVAVRGLLGLWRISIDDEDARRELPFDPLELTRAVASDECSIREEVDRGEADKGAIGESSPPTYVSRRLAWDAARGEAMVLVWNDDGGEDGSGMENPVHASLTEYLDYVHLRASCA